MKNKSHKEHENEKRIEGWAREKFCLECMTVGPSEIAKKTFNRPAFSIKRKESDKEGENDA